MNTCYIQVPLKELEIGKAFKQLRGRWREKTMTSAALRVTEINNVDNKNNIETASSSSSSAGL